MTDYNQAVYYFATAGDANKIYPELGPTTIPGTDDEWTASNKKCLGGENAYGAYTPGNVRTYVGGCGTGAKTLTLEFMWMSNAKLALIIALRDTLAQFIFYDGTTKWLCMWEGSKPIAPKGITGCKTGFAVTITLRIQGTVA